MNGRKADGLRRHDHRALALACTAFVGLAWAPAAQAGDVTQERLSNADQEHGNWLTLHKDYSARCFSRLDQINRNTVKSLKVAFTVALGGVEGGGIWTHGGLESTPIVEDGFLYVTDGWGSVYKVDAQGGRGRVVWKTDPKIDHDWAGAIACCGVNNRGVALWDGMVISHSLDGRLIATDKDTGEVAWQRQVADPDKGEVVTAAPLVVKGLAITGVAGADLGIRGWIAATDLKTQKEVWRTYTIPAAGEPGSETWKNKGTAANGGGSTWVTGSYDPATNTLIWGVGNPGPDWDNTHRPGDNLYTDSALALDPDRQDQVALPAHAERPLRLRQRLGERAGGRADKRQAHENGADGRSQRLRLRGEPGQRRVHLGHILCQAADLDQGAERGNG